MFVMATVDRGRPLNVLIVEDNKGAAGVFQALLNVHGHRAVVAHDGSQALDMARTESVDVVICDLGLPDMDGFEVVRRMRADPAIPYHPVCALTSRTDEASRRKAAEVGFDGYIVKPPNFPELIGFLKKYQR
jgi:DNA-binding response OmpR family regulator